MKYSNLILIGTSHIAQESINSVKEVIEKEDPEYIAIELDKARLESLLRNDKQRVRFKDIFRIGLKGYIFALIGAWAEKKLGNMVGVSPGSEMIMAARMAKSKRKKLLLIDQDIGITLRKLSKSITWKEKWHFIVDIFQAVFFRKKEIEFDLTKVPPKKVIEKMVGQVRKRYPSIYNVLIKERNYYMAGRLSKAMEENPDKKIVAFVGAGHEEEIISIIKKIEKGMITYTYNFNISK